LAIRDSGTNIGKKGQLY